MADLFSSAEFTLLHDYMLVDANQKKQMEYYVRYAQNQWGTSFLDEGETLVFTVNITMLFLDIKI